MPRSKNRLLEWLSHKISVTITGLFISTVSKEIVFFKIFQRILYYVEKCVEVTKGLYYFP